MNEETQLQPVVVEELTPKIADETKTLVTLKNFEYLINQPKCAVDESSNTPFFVILVNSHPDNAELRQAIRDTWAHYDKRIKTYFLLGSTKSVEHQQRIKAENDEFFDIIQGNFIDSFRMLSHKDVMGLKWFTENCEVAKYLVKVDDDVFANVPALYDYLKSNKNDKIFVLGDYREPEVCPRTGEFAVTEVEYASDYFPSYALSHSIVYSSDIVAQLYEKSCTSEFFFHWADVYVNGLLRAQINVDITSIKEFILTEESMNGKYSSFFFIQVLRLTDSTRN